MALTRARVIAGPPALNARVEAAIRTALVKPRDHAKVAADVLDMRERIAKEKGTDSIWDLKQVRGGLVDLEFIAQFLQLVHASGHPEVLDQNTVEAFRRLRNAHVLDPADSDVLIPGTRLLHDLTQVVRLCVEGPFDPATAPKGLQELLARAGDAASFSALEARLREALESNARLFRRLIA
jgi:glutamate-ammonia-ligase adenylyltransferase